MRRSTTVQRADPHCDQFSSQHAEPWKAVRSKDEGASSMSATSKLIEEKAIKKNSEPIASLTTLSETKRGSCSGFITLRDGSDDVSVR